MKSNHVLAAAAVAVAFAGAPLAHAQGSEPAPHAGHHAEPAATAADVQELRSEGEVRKVNREAGKVTLRHGPLTNLDMPAMTMVFAVAEPALLDGLKEGDRVRFAADQKDGALRVTAIRVVR